jgi:predicted DNA-binding protein YlxM (UPF0122 family)
MAESLRIEKLADIALLVDFYGVLLTEKQRTALELCYEEDLSLAEIAAECDCSRQAAHDLIKRSEALLRDYEAKLQLVERHNKFQQLLAEAEAELLQLGIKPENKASERFWQLWQNINPND